MEQVPITVGMEADDVLKIPGFSKEDAIKPPLVIGKDGYGYRVRWFYHNLALIMHRRRVDGKLAYRVREVRPFDPKAQEAI